MSTFTINTTYASLTAAKFYSLAKASGGNISFTTEQNGNNPTLYSLQGKKSSKIFSMFQNAEKNIQRKEANRNATQLYLETIGRQFGTSTKLLIADDLKHRLESGKPLSARVVKEISKKILELQGFTVEKTKKSQFERTQNAPQPTNVQLGDHDRL